MQLPTYSSHVQQCISNDATKSVATLTCNSSAGCCGGMNSQRMLRNIRKRVELLRPFSRSLSLSSTCYKLHIHVVQQLDALGLLRFELRNTNRSSVVFSLPLLATRPYIAFCASPIETPLQPCRIQHRENARRHVGKLDERMISMQSHGRKNEERAFNEA